MRCLVTGASGHLGSALVRWLQEQGHEVTGMVRPTSNLWRLPKDVRLIHGDLTALPALEPVDAVFHLAWEGVTSQSRDDPRQLSVNYTGSLRLWENAQHAGAKFWVGVGSQAERQPTTRYGEAKRRTCEETQRLCAQAGMKFLWLRLLATYGPADDERHLIPTVIRKLLARERPALTSGKQRWDYLYVDDAAEAMGQAVERSEGVFDLASGEARPVREIVERIRDLIDPQLPLGFGELPDDGRNLEADMRPFCQATGWKPSVSLAEGLQRTVAWYRNQI